MIRARCAGIIVSCWSCGTCPRTLIAASGGGGPHLDHALAAAGQHQLHLRRPAGHDGGAERGADQFACRTGEQVLCRLVGRAVETLIPVGLRAAHRSHRAGYAQAPTARPMEARRRLVGLGKADATFPIEISLSPVPAATGQFTLAAIRDTTTARQRDDLIHLAQATAAEQAHNGRKLPDRVLSNLLKAGLSLQAAIDLSDGVAAQHITEALSRLDDAIHDIPYDVPGNPDRATHDPSFTRRETLQEHRQPCLNRRQVVFVPLAFG